MLLSGVPNRSWAREATTGVSAITNSSDGKLSMMSINRLSSVSTQPPKYPDTIPITVPSTTAMTVPPSATSSETRVP